MQSSSGRGFPAHLHEMMETINISDLVRKSDKPLILYLTATWCMPCRMMAPVLENVRHDYRDRVELVKLNADANPHVLKALKVYGVPTLIGYHKGSEVLRRTGAQSRSQLIGLFESVIQEKVVTKSMSPLDRYLRLGTGLAIMLYGWFSSSSILLAFFGGLIAFSAVYDRCPVYKAVSIKIKEIWKNIRA